MNKIELIAICEVTVREHFDRGTSLSHGMVGLGSLVSFLAPILASQPLGGQTEEIAQWERACRQIGTSSTCSNQHNKVPFACLPNQVHEIGKLILSQH